MTRYMRWLAAERGQRFDGYEALWEWSVTELEEFWASIWEFFEVAGLDRLLRGSVAARDAGRPVVSGRRAELREHIFRGKRDADVAVLHASELRPLREVTLGRAPRAGGARRRRASGLGSRARRPRRRLSCRTSPRRWSPSWRPLRSGRSGRAARRTSAPRASSTASRRSAQGAALHRRLSLQRQRLRPARDRRRPAASRCRPWSTRSSSPTSPTVPTSRAWTARCVGRACSTGAAERRARLRAGPLRPSAVGPVLVGDHRTAEGDRPGPRRESCSSSSRSSTCTSTPRTATASSGSRPRDG